MILLEILKCDIDYSEDNIERVYEDIDDWGNWNYAKFKEEFLFTLVGGIVVPLLIVLAFKSIIMDWLSVFTLSLPGFTLLTVSLFFIGLLVFSLQWFHWRLQHMLLRHTVIRLKSELLNEYISGERALEYIKNHIKKNWRI